MISAILLSALSLASAQKNVTLTIESDSSFNGKGLSHIHFGAAIEGVLISNTTVTYDLNTTDDSVYWTLPVSGVVSEVPLRFSVLSDELVLGPGNEGIAKVSDDYLTINGSSSVFYACKHIDYDPYYYLNSTGTYGVGVYASDAPSDCTAIKIHVTDTDSGNSTTTVSSTDYVTIPCSTPTTVTYGTGTYTVTAPTTLTVEDCSCTDNSAISTKASSTGVSMATSSATTSAALANGAERIVVGGVAGLAAAALLI